MCAENIQTCFLTSYILKLNLRLCCYISMAHLVYDASFGIYCEAPWAAIAVKKTQLFHSMALVQLRPLKILH